MKKLLLVVSILCALTFAFTSCSGETKRPNLLVDVQVDTSGKQDSESSSKSLTVSYNQIEGVVFEYLMVPESENPIEGYPITNPSNGPTECNPELYTEDWVWNKADDSCWKELIEENETVGKASTGLWSIFVRVMANAGENRVKLYEGNAKIYMSENNHVFHVSLKPSEANEVAGSLCIRQMLPFSSEDFPDAKFTCEIYNLMSSEVVASVSVPTTAVSLTESEGFLYYNIDYTFDNLQMGMYRVGLEMFKDERLVGRCSWMVKTPQPRLSELVDGKMPDFVVNSYESK